MMQGEGGMRLVREVLEGVLAPKLAQAILFEALGASATMPESPDDIMHLVRGPVREAVAQRTGASEATAVVARLEHIINRRLSQPPPAGDGDATVAVPTEGEAVPVLVIASGPGLGGRLAAALGPERVAPRHTPDPSEDAGLLSASVILVDATDFTATDPNQLAMALCRAPATTAIAVWGINLPYGRKLRFALEEMSVQAMTFDQATGIEPLLDLVRSRRRQ
jgi:hypothetical protein